MPPLSEVLEVGWKLLLPSLAASLVVAFGLALLNRRLVPVAAALAVAAGFLVGNHIRELVPYRVDAEKQLTFADWQASAEASLEPRPPTEEEGPAVPPPAYWLPWLMALAMAAELACLLGANSGAAWSVRAVVALMAARLLTPPGLRVELAWWPWLLGVAILVQWGIAGELSRREDRFAALAQSVCLVAAAVVILNAHSGRLSELSLLAAMAVGGPALAAWVWPASGGVAAAAGAVALPALALIAWQDTVSEVPAWSFAVAACAPVALAPLLLASVEGWKRLALAAVWVAIPAAVAVGSSLG